MQSRIELSAAPGQLRCELLPQPLGIGTALPGFSWQSMDTRTAEIESAWQVLVASDRSMLVPTAASPEGDLWDSGVVSGSSRGLAVAYAGVPLVSRQRAWWTVRTFDSDGLSSGFAEPACFEVGLLSNADWHGDWLSVPWQGSATDGGPVAAFIRDFQIDVIPTAARLYIAVLGRAVVQLNGRAVDAGVGDAEAGDPGQRRRYRTLDVTSHLLPGANRLGVLLGEGAHCGNYLLPGARESFATAPALLAQLEWRDAGGRLHRVVSDGAWQLFRSSIVASDPVLGEALDQRRWNPNWSVPEVPIDWEPAALRPATQKPVPLIADARYGMEGPPRASSELLTLDALEYLVPESRAALPRPRLNGLLIDLGSVRSGRLRVDGHFNEGDRLLVHYARSRKELPAAFDSDRFTSAAGDGELEAQLAERPFRFARLAGNVEWRDVEAIRFSSTDAASERLGVELSECDQPVLAAVMARASSQLELALVDRPAFSVVTTQRQALRPISWLEPLAGCPTTLTLLGKPAGIRRWIEDARDALNKFGYLPRALPAAEGDELLAPEGRSDLFVQMLWIAYSGFGDQAALRLAIPELELLVARWQSKTRERFFNDPSWNDERRLPAEYVGGARLGIALALAAELAEQVDALRAAGQFRRFAAELRAGFRARYLTADGQLLFRSLDACLFALAAGYLEEAEAAAAVADLVRALQPIVRSGADLPVLPELYATLFEQLFTNDQADLAYQLLILLCARSLEQSSNDPSNDPQLRPAVTLTTDDSEPLSWMPWGQLLEVCYGYILGVRLPYPLLDRRPAFRDCAWRPHPPRPSTVAAGSGVVPTRIKAQLRTVSGLLTFGWRLEDGKLYCLSELPADLLVQLELPNGQSLRQSAGEHEFAVDLEAEGDGIPVLLDAIRGAVPRAGTAHS